MTSLTIAEIKEIIKKRIYRYANCSLSVNNPYYVNSGAIQSAEDWFNDFKQVRELPEKQVKSIEQHFKMLRGKYLYN